MEDVQKANNELLTAKKIMNQTRQENLAAIRQMELDHCVGFFDEVVRQYAKPDEQHSFDSLIKTAQKSIERNDSNFDNILDNMKTKNTLILLRQDWFIIDWYQRATASNANYVDMARFAELKHLGKQALEVDDMKQLRQILFELWDIQIRPNSGDGMFDDANIVKG